MAYCQSIEYFGWTLHFLYNSIHINASIICFIWEEREEVIQFILHSETLMWCDEIISKGFTDFLHSLQNISITSQDDYIISIATERPILPVYNCLTLFVSNWPQLTTLTPIVSPCPPYIGLHTFSIFSSSSLVFHLQFLFLYCHPSWGLLSSILNWQQGLQSISIRHFFRRGWHAFWIWLNLLALGRQNWFGLFVLHCTTTSRQAGLRRGFFYPFFKFFPKLLKTIKQQSTNSLY